MTLEELYKKIEAYINQQKELGSEIYIDREEIARKIVLEEVEDQTYCRLEQIKRGQEIFNIHEGFYDELTGEFYKFPEDWMDVDTLEQLYKNIHNCTKCPLGFSRLNFVFGSGNPNADIMIIGEAPGAEEDEQGMPFVGRAGQLLTKILKSINLEREEVYIANILKCRPPENRVPLPYEVDKCEPYLKCQIDLINPYIILALGLTAANTLLKKKFKMGEIRGKIFEYQRRKMLVTYHPAALLRNPNYKRDVWEDVKLLRKLYDEYLAKK